MIPEEFAELLEEKLPRDHRERIEAKAEEARRRDKVWPDPFPIPHRNHRIPRRVTYQNGRIPIEYTMNEELRDVMWYMALVRDSTTRDYIAQQDRFYAEGSVLTHFAGIHVEVGVAHKYGEYEAYAEGLVWGVGDNGVDLVKDGCALQAKGTKFYPPHVPIYLLAKQGEILNQHAMPDELWERTKTANPPRWEELEPYLRQKGNRADVFILGQVDEPTGYVELIGKTIFDAMWSKRAKYPFRLGEVREGSLPSFALHTDYLKPCKLPQEADV